MVPKYFWYHFSYLSKAKLQYFLFVCDHIEADIYTAAWKEAESLYTFSYNKVTFMIITLMCKGKALLYLGVKICLLKNSCLVTF